VGINSIEVLGVGIDTLADTDLRKRIPGIMDTVSGPPGTEVDIIYNYFNNSGHSIDISKVLIPFSKNNPEEGNWLNVVKSDTGEPEERNVRIYYDFRWIIKTGLLKEYQGLGVLEEGEEGSLVLDTLTITNPIKIKTVEVEELNPGVVKLLVNLENLTENSLEGLLFEHHRYSLEFNMDPLEEVTIEYVLEDFSELDYFKISNLKPHTECAIYGNSTYNWFWGQGVTAVAFREDGGWVKGAIVQPEGDVFCITRIPYSMTSEILEYEKSIDDDNMEEENDVILEEEREVIVEEEVERITNKELEEKVTLQEEMGKEEGDENQVLGVMSEERDDVVKEEKIKDFVLPKTGVVR